jgi:hypothetical protein
MHGMSRFNPLGHSSTGDKEKEKEKEKDSENRRQSLTSISSMAKSFGGINISNLTGSALGSTDQDKKTKIAAAERKAQIANVLTILEDVHLQCPPSHTGLILAYAGASCSPIINPGIKFTWFRMSGDDQVDQVDESFKAWYAPTVDDIGSVICAQCEDNFDQGCSRYNEVSYIVFPH